MSDERPRPRFVVPVQGGRAVRPPHPVHPGQSPAAPHRPEGGDRSGDERFRALFEHAPVGVALSDPDGSFTDVNRALRDLLAGTGIDPDRDGPADLARDAPADTEAGIAWRRDLADVVAGRMPVARAELVLPRGADGAGRWVQVTSALIVLGDARYVMTHVEDVTGRRAAEDRLRHLAQHDGLTGLANRALLAQRLCAAAERSRAAGLRVGLVHLDLDDFKLLNDAWGHDAGDRVLAEAGARLGAALRVGDTAGRVGGDEFVVVAGDVPDGAALDDLCRRLAAAVSRPYDVQAKGAAPDGAVQHVTVTASAGGVLVLPGETLEAALARAERAMFDVKHRRRTGRPTALVDVDALNITVVPDDFRDASGSAGERPGGTDVRG